MADKAEKKPDAAPAGKEGAKPAAPAKGAEGHGASKASGGGIFTKLPVLIAVVMVVEAAALIGGYKIIGGGAKNANAADLTMPLKTDKTEGGTEGDKAASADQSKTTELELVKSSFPNKQSGRTFLYDVDIFLSVKTEDADKVKKIIADHDALIKDRVRTIIAQSDPDKLGGGSEPGLETLRRQVKFQLTEIVGDGMIDDVLVPRCVPFRTDY